MKVLVVPDIHGRRELLPTEEEISLVDKIVFLGDYLDSFDETPQEQLEVLELVIEIKKKFGDKIILLLGNHDIHYIFNKYICSGYNQKFALAFGALLYDNIKLFQYSYMYGNHLFTHAGVDIRLLQAIEAKFSLEKGYNLEHILNTSHIKELYYIGKESGGIDPFGGIFWARPWQIKLPKEYIQHVGHTPHVHSNYFNSLINYYDGNGKKEIEISI